MVSSLLNNHGPTVVGVGLRPSNPNILREDVETRDEVSFLEGALTANTHIRFQESDISDFSDSVTDIPDDQTLMSYRLK